MPDISRRKGLQERIERCRRQARKAATLAEAARDRELKLMFKDLAENWNELADLLHRMAADSVDSGA